MHHQRKETIRRRNIRKIKTEEMDKYSLKSPHVSCLYYIYKSGSLTAKELSDRFGVSAKDLFCTIGPCICADCYEVSKELYDDFVQKFGKREYLISGSFYG